MTRTPALERFRRLKELFGEALERPPAERETFIEVAAGGDDALAQEAKALLDAHARDGGFVEEIVAAEARDLVAPERAADFAGRRIGAYELIRLIGAGGMGTVFLARRADAEYEAEVALKIVRPGLFSEEILRRFRAERQALANLNHPGIARLLDGGTTADGVPYLVMEHVKGLPIDEWAARKAPGIAERVALFRHICDAIQYAHRNLIVHRDVKPANILVTEEGEVKVLDFGIAKFLGEEETGLTRTGERVLTPDYASPEQIRGAPITTATDVYSLGVVLYRLLTSRHPYAFGSGRASEIERVVCETEPDRPSAAEARLRGDLDNIVLKALRKEPERRYASVEQLSEDLRRFLEGEPVRARRDTVGYRGAKFLLRHRAGAAAVGLVILSLAAGLVMSMRSARAARVEAQKAEEINAFLKEILGAASPWRDGSQVTVKEVLDRASQRIDSELAGQPEVEAGVRRTIGETYAGLGMYEPAELQLRKALERTRRVRGPVHDEVADSLEALAALRTNRGDTAAAEAPAREALAMRRTLHGEKHETVAAAWNRLGNVFQARGELDFAEEAQRTAVRIYRESAPQSAGLGSALNDLAVTLGTRGDSSAALALHREALVFARRAHAGPHPEVAEALSTLASDVWDTRRDAKEAEALYEQALAMRRALFGRDHPDVTWTLYNYAHMLMERGECGRAETLGREALKGRGTTLPDEHPMVASTLLVLGRCRLAAGASAGAEPFLRESLALRQRTLPADHWLLASNRSFLGESLARQHRDAEARPLLQAGYEGLRARFGESSPRTKDAAQRLDLLGK